MKISKRVCTVVIVLYSLQANAEWDQQSCAEAKDWAKLAAIQYTTGESKQYAMGYARELYRKTGSQNFNEDGAAMTVDITWRYLVNDGTPPSPPPPEMLRSNPNILNDFYEDTQEAFYEWCISN